MRVAFYSPHLCLRGTSVAVFDYAWGNQSVLRNESIVIYNANHPTNHAASVARFKNSLDVVGIEHGSLLEDAVKAIRADACYTLKGGFRDGVQVKSCRMLIHATAMAPPSEWHGTRYAYVSEWMSIELSKSEIPFVPHMVSIPDVSGDLRTELGIPETATVFGRTGGLDTWNIPFASAAVLGALEARDDLWFVFQNTPAFASHPRLLQVDPTPDLERKVRFINTCDAMLHARHEGESFGLACAEFSYRNKPVLTWSGSRERSHIFQLKDRGLYYRTQEELVKLLVEFEKHPEKNWNCYEAFTPDRVMEKFREVFLS